MNEEQRVVSPGPRENTVRLANGEIVPVPTGWVLLPPGDAALTRRVKAGGPTWGMEQKKGRKRFSLGVWAPGERIAQIRVQLEAERARPAYAKRQAANASRRDRKQTQYVGEFHEAVVAFLDFHERYQALCQTLAAAVTELATPVGSGTVARTERIPLERRAESAVIAWMRHQTTGYDQMVIARVKGRRREVRRILAAHSRTLLERYRSGAEIAPESCPLQQALNRDFPGQPGKTATEAD